MPLFAKPYAEGERIWVGPVGYWGDDGFFWCNDVGHNWHRDEGHHFVRTASAGLNHIHGTGARREH